MQRYINKIQNSNPLPVLGLDKLHKAYKEANTDEDIVSVIHTALNIVEGADLGECLMYDMVARTLDMPVNPLYYEMVRMISTHNTKVNHGR